MVVKITMFKKNEFHPIQFQTESTLTISSSMSLDVAMSPFSKHQSHALTAFQWVLRNPSQPSTHNTSLPSLSSLASLLRRDSFWFALFPSARAPWSRFVDAVASVSHGSRHRSGSDDDDADDSDQEDGSLDNRGGDYGSSDEVCGHRRVGDERPIDATLMPLSVDESERVFRSQIAEVYRDQT